MVDADAKHRDELEDSDDAGELRRNARDARRRGVNEVKLRCLAHEPHHGSQEEERQRAVPVVSAFSFDEEDVAFPDSETDRHDDPVQTELGGRIDGVGQLSPDDVAEAQQHEAGSAVEVAESFVRLHFILVRYSEARVASEKLNHIYSYLSIYSECSKRRRGVLRDAA